MKPQLCFFLLFASISAFAQKDSATAKADTLPAKTMSEVVIAGARRFVDVQPDKTVLNVDAQPQAAGENALDVLRRSPGVSVDGADNLQLLGKPGVNVMIDGKPSQLSAQDLAGLLKSIAAANVRQIELITNPSSKYDAQGAAGIINIKLKKSLTDGFTGNLSAGYVQSRHARGNVSANLNWRRNNTAVFLNGSWNEGLQHTIARNDRRSGDRLFTQRSVEKDSFGGRTLRAGADVALSKEKTIGLLWMHNVRNTGLDNISTTLMESPFGTDTVYQTRSRVPFATQRNAFNVNYAFSGPHSELTLDADLTRFRSSVYNVITNELQNGSGAKLGTAATTNDQGVVITLYSLKGDWSKNLRPSLKLETGAKWMATRTENSLWVQNAEGSQWALDTGKTNGFRYRENIAAAYATLRGERGKLLWQAGIRAERSRVVGRSTDLKGNELAQPDTAYLNLFPTAFLQYRLKQNQSLGFSFSRRIDRPNYQDQNPFIYFLDALNTERGNAYLKPQFTTNVEINYTRNYATSVKLGYARTTDYIDQLTYQTGKYTVMIPQNAGTKEMVSLSISSPVRFNKRWSAYVSLTPYYHYYRILLSGFGNAEAQSGGSFAFNGYVGNNLDLGKGWKGSVSSWFNFQNRATIYVSKPLGSLDLGMQKTILKEKATVKLSVVDVFNTQRWEQRAVTADLQLTTHRKWESQNITLGFGWQFGNSKVKKAREREGANEEGMNRIK